MAVNKTITIDHVDNILTDSMVTATMSLPDNWQTYSSNITSAQGLTVNPWVFSTNTISDAVMSVKGPALSVKGPAEFDSDITVQGRSLTDFIEKVEQRLNILQPNAKLESEWDQLRELGEQYRALEKELIDKAKMWNTLKK